MARVTDRRVDRWEMVATMSGEIDVDYHREIAREYYDRDDDTRIVSMRVERHECGEDCREQARHNDGVMPCDPAWRDLVVTVETSFED